MKRRSTTGLLCAVFALCMAAGVTSVVYAVSDVYAAGAEADFPFGKCQE